MPVGLLCQLCLLCLFITTRLYGLYWRNSKISSTDMGSPTRGKEALNKGVASKDFKKFKEKSKENKVLG